MVESISATHYEMSEWAQIHNICLWSMAAVLLKCGDISPSGLRWGGGGGREGEKSQMPVVFSCWSVWLSPPTASSPPILFSLPPFSSPLFFHLSRGCDVWSCCLTLRSTLLLLFSSTWTEVRKATRTETERENKKREEETGRACRGSRRGLGKRGCLDRVPLFIAICSVQSV